MAKLQGKNRKNRLDRLLETDDPVFDTVADGPLSNDPVEAGYLKMKPCKEARNIVRGIEEYIGLEVFPQINTLANEYKDSKKKYPFAYKTTSNAMLAVAYAGLGEKANAEKIIAGIENVIGFDENGKIKNSKIDNISANDSNYTLAVAYAALGQYSKARNVMRSVEDFPNHEEMMSDIWYSSAIQGLAHVCTGKPEMMIGYQDSEIFKTWDLTTDTNTQIFVSILDCCLLNFDAGHKKVVFYDFDTNFKTKNLSRGRFLVRAAKEEHHYTYTNAAAAIAYMTREYLKNG